MANENAKPNFFVKVGRFFKNLGLGVANSFKMMFHELKKVTWPSRRELVNYSLVVIGFMVAMGVIIGLIDAGASALVQLISR
ncbi:MAG: preprotein translocase subunit SecE [Clostridiales bacterium]|nr:preprotein translocase subunit SecE [Clostridiales bacterium]